ncbi:MAG TPA: carboxypeptidase-like regulatory domain-containing protein [Candidatus Acidoferrales bacterium]|nr:carboxypeptidase-like regulatory domain-containing protein [Candidatus Acidoferrales bacterium]
MNAARKLLIIVMIYSFFAGQTAMALSEEKSIVPLPSSGNVTLSLAEYNRLVDLAAKSMKAHEKPPIAYTIERADLKLNVGADSVLGTVLLDGQIFSKVETKVPLANGMTILNARQQGKGLPLFEEGHTATAVLPGESAFSVELDAGLPLAIEAGRASFSLPAPAAGSVRLVLAIPGEHTDVRISPGLITSRSSEKGQTTIEAALVPGQTANVWWTTREIAAPVAPKEVRFLSEVKTLVSVGEADLKIAALADITMLQGEPAEFAVKVPEDFEITDVSGATVESSDEDSGILTIHLTGGAQKSHQFLISMERTLNDSKAEVPFISFKDAQRETGEVLVEGAGAMELTAKEGGSLKRMDVKEVNPFLRSLAHSPLQAAFRYHREPNEAPALALAWTRFPDSNVLAAVAEHAVVTTLVTSEGRSLTEVDLTIRNQAQPFLKVDLPQGATILSADVAGEKVKPVQGPDGNRVPLLRANFRPEGAYNVSYVFMHSGTPFAKKGGSEIALPSMDVPISVLEWEVFLPEQYKVKHFGGDAIAESLLPPIEMQAAGEPRYNGGIGAGYGGGVGGGISAPAPKPLLPGQVGGVVVDPQGAVIAGATVKVTQAERGITRVTTSDSFGNWAVSGIPTGRVKVEVSAPGFQSSVLNIDHSAENASRADSRLSVGSATETVEVTAEAPMIETTQSQVGSTFSMNGPRTSSGRGRDKKKDQAQPASQNVFNLQKRVAGVLPVSIDVPRAGHSYRFARALVLDEQTKLSFEYKTK